MTIASIESISAKAEKQFDDTGNLQGFSASCRSGSSEGVTGLSVSAIPTSAAADEDGVILAYALDVNSAVGKTGERGLSAQQIAELMDVLSGLRGAATLKAAARLNRPGAKKARAAADAHA